MSGPDRPPEPSVPTTALKRKRFSNEDQKELDKLDGVFKRIKTAVPRAPYILSTPSLDPYKYHSRHEARAWMMGHLFEPHEELLQYRTYLFREPYQDCFTLQHGEDDELDAPRPKSQASNTTNQPPKKKISLSDYKSKQANGLITPGSKKVSPNLPATKATSAQTNGVKAVEKRPPPAQPKPETKPQKRPATESLAPEKPEKRAREERPSAAPAAPPPKAEPVDSKINLDKSGASNATPHGLPPLLSPVDQPLSNPYGLPAILSPTLPSNIQAELDKIETQRKRAVSDASTSSSDRKSQLLSVPEPRAPKQGEGTKSGSRERSVSLNEKSPSGVIVNRTENPKPSLIVKLKYTKKSRETIKRLLNLPPKREGAGDRKEREETVKDRALDTRSRGTDGIASQTKKPTPKVAARRPESSTPSSKAPVAPTKVTEKRPRSEDDASQGVSKRPRAHTLQEGPITPKEQVVSSPALSNKSSAQKSQGPYVTPRKDHKAINMLRANSSEGFDVTPGRSGTTPTGSKFLDVKAPTSAPLNSKKQLDFNALSQASQQLNQMGRSLKYEGQKMEREKGNKLSKEDQKRAAVIGLECVLSYMTAFYAGDLLSQSRGRPAEVENTWKTLLPLCAAYARLTKDFQHLDGIRNHFATVIAAHICMLIAPRAPNPKAHDSPQDPPELVKQHTQVIANFYTLSDHYVKLLRHAQDARIGLPIEDIEKQYQKTWAGREKDAKLAKVPERVDGARFTGRYFLPIQDDTTPIQAVRFGLKFLSEYCDKEQLDYTFRLQLNKLE